MSQHPNLQEIAEEPHRPPFLPPQLLGVEFKSLEKGPVHLLLPIREDHSMVPRGCSGGISPCWIRAMGAAAFSVLETT